MAKVDSRGFVDDGSSSLSVAGGVTVTGGLTVGTSIGLSAQTLAGSGSVAISAPGFYYVPASGSSGAGYFTGSVPAAASWPGSQLVVKDTLGVFNWLLTGSATVNNGSVFVLPITSSVQRIAGTKLSITPSGSVVFVSDGARWLMTAGSGSFTLTGLTL